MITLAIEHKSIIDPAKKLLDEGFDVTFLPVDTYGLLDLRDLVKAIRKDTVMVSMMSANNEIGVIQSVEEIGGICRKHNVIFHTDGAQAFCKMPIDVTKQSIDLLSLSSHKIYGPKGIGALYVRNQKPRVKLSPIIFGGGHERGLRSGTLNTPAIVGFGEACNITKKEMDLEQKAIKDLRNLLLRELSIRINDLRVNGSLEQRLSGNLNIEIPGVDSEALLFSLKKIAISSGSACTSHTFEPSHVLLALGLDSRRAMNCIRFGLGRFNTQEDIKIAVEEITYHVDRIRKLRGWI
jgi:cysteine desulfurase